MPTSININRTPFALAGIADGLMRGFMMARQAKKEDKQFEQQNLLFDLKRRKLMLSEQESQINLAIMQRQQKLNEDLIPIVKMKAEAEARLKKAQALEAEGRLDLQGEMEKLRLLQLYQNLSNQEEIKIRLNKELNDYLNSVGSVNNAQQRVIDEVEAGMDPRSIVDKTLGKNVGAGNFRSLSEFSRYAGGARSAAIPTVTGTEPRETSATAAIPSPVSAFEAGGAMSPALQFEVMSATDLPLEDRLDIIKGRKSLPKRFGTVGTGTEKTVTNLSTALKRNAEIDEADKLEVQRQIGSQNPKQYSEEFFIDLTNELRKYGGRDITPDMVPPIFTQAAQGAAQADYLRAINAGDTGIAAYVRRAGGTQKPFIDKWALQKAWDDLGLEGSPDIWLRSVDDKLSVDEISSVLFDNPEIGDRWVNAKQGLMDELLSTRLIRSAIMKSTDAEIESLRASVETRRNAVEEFFDQPFFTSGAGGVIGATAKGVAKAIRGFPKGERERISRVGGAAIGAITGGGGEGFGGGARNFLDVLRETSGERGREIGSYIGQGLGFNSISGFYGAMRERAEPTRTGGERGPEVPMFGGRISKPPLLRAPRSKPPLPQAPTSSSQTETNIQVVRFLISKGSEADRLAAQAQAERMLPIDLHRKPNESWTAWINRIARRI